MNNFKSILIKIRKQQRVLTSLLLVGFTGIIGLSFHKFYKRQIDIYEIEKLNTLSAIVKSGITLINGDKFEKLLKLTHLNSSDSLSSYYYILKEKLKKLQTLNHLNTEVYTLSHLNHRSKSLSLIVNSGDSVWFKHDYTTPQLLFEIYQKGGKIGPYVDEHGKWLSAFYPIKNSSNQVVGSLHADIKFNEFEELVTDEVLADIGKVVIELLIVLLVLAFITRFKLSSIGKLRNTFNELTETISAKNQELTLAKKEIGDRNLRLAELNENLELKVGEATSMLTAKNHELNLFFYHASHQMKTPIVNILGLVELAKMEEQHSDLVNYLNKIGKLSRRTIRLLDQLNKVSHTNTGGNETVALSKFLSTCAKDNPFRNCVNLTSKCKNVSFKTNPYLLQVILDAVLENAIYFSRKQKGDDAQVEVRCLKTKDVLSIQILDNGSGIKAELLDDACKMFFVGSPVSKGNGLGLYLAQHAVDQLNGNLKILSTENEYFKVIIDIPIE